MRADPCAMGTFERLNSCVGTECGPQSPARVLRDPNHTILTTRFHPLKEKTIFSRSSISKASEVYPLKNPANHNTLALVAASTVPRACELLQSPSHLPQPWPRWPNTPPGFRAPSRLGPKFPWGLCSLITMPASQHFFQPLNCTPLLPPHNTPAHSTRCSWSVQSPERLLRPLAWVCFPATHTPPDNTNVCFHERVFLLQPQAQGGKNHTHSAHLHPSHPAEGQQMSTRHGVT